MKKILNLLLVLCLCLALLAGCGSGNATHEYILHLLETGDYDMAIYVIEGLRDGASNPQPGGDVPGVQQTVRPGGSSAVEGRDQFYELEPECNGSDWFFHMDLINQSDEVLTLEAILITDLMDGQECGVYEWAGEDLNQLPMGKLVLEPNTGRGWDDAHPMVAHFNGREYRHIFHDAQGEQVIISYTFDMRKMMPEESPDSGNGPVDGPTGDWHFPCVLENNADTPWTLVAVDITDRLDGQPLGTYIFESAEDLERIGLGGVVLEPGQYLNWGDGHPVVPDWNGREYRFHFRDGNGQTQTLSFLFNDLDQQGAAVDYSQDDGKDLKTLRHDASFQQEVYDGVYWVPAVALGASRYSNGEISQMVDADPEYKQDHISTLYEALQLYQIGNFTPSDDNVRIYENGVNWEHHKPGFHAVRTNTGCCATDSNWLRYILDGDYEEVGFLATSQRDGGGHVYNYILQDGWYYFIDLTHYHASGGPINTAEENGKMSSYHATDFILGNIHKTKSIQNYVDYVQQAFNDPPGLMFMYTAENVLAVDGAPSDGGVQIIYEEANGQKIEVIFDDSGDSLTFGRAPSPKNLPDWNNLP